MITSQSGQRQWPRPAAGARQVLVVEDNRPSRILMQTLLDGFGCVPTLAPSGAQALELCADQTFDLILMDIRMPGMDGIEALHRLRAGGGPNAATPVVALTANTAEEDHRRFLAAGIAEIVIKPVSPVSLAAAIDKNTLAPLSNPMAI